MKPVINSVKHIVQKSLTLIPEQTLNVTTIIKVDATPTGAGQVVIGAVVKAVYLEFWLIGESAQPCTATWAVEKLPNDGTDMTQAQSQVLDDYPNKRNLLKIGQGVIGDSNTNPIPIIREWIKIPKGKQRWAQGDELHLNVSCIGEADNGLEICGLAIYKEYQ